MESKKRIDELSLNQSKIKSEKIETAISEVMSDSVFSKEEFEELLKKFWESKQIIYQKYLEINSEILLEFTNELDNLLDNISSENFDIWLIKIIDKNKKLKYRFFEKFFTSDSFSLYIYINHYLQDKNSKEIFKEIAKKDPFWFFDFVYKYWKPVFYEEIKKEILKKEIILNATKEDCNWAKINFREFKKESYIKEILLVIAENEPYYIFELVKEFKKESYAKEILEKSVEKNWMYAFQFFKDLKKEPYAKEILKQASFVLNKMDLNENEYLRIWQFINEQHEESDENRFLIISQLSDLSLYNLIVNWRSEVFTSTYNWIISKLFVKLKKSQKDIYDLALENDFKWVNIFVEARAAYNKLDLLFNNIKTLEKKKLLIDKLLDEERINANLPDYVAILEIIQKNKDKELENYIFDKINNNIQNWKNKEYWLIVAKESNKVNPNFFKKIPEKYSLPEIKDIDEKILFNSKWKNIQQYFFYPDEDWKSSFQSFISNYKQSSEWKIEDKGTFVIIKSKENNNRQIQIFANKPEAGIENIKSYFDKEVIVPQIIVHRGHSFHAKYTIEKITSNTKLVFLWSCWWFQEVSNVVWKSIDSSVISTKWTWSMTINEPLFKEINEQIINSWGIKWNEIWWKMSKKLSNNDYFLDYVNPKDNYVLKFSKKLEELKKEW